MLVRDAADPARSRILATAALGGIELYALDGQRLGRTPAGDVASVDVAYGVELQGKPHTVLAAVDTTDNRLREGDHRLIVADPSPSVLRLLQLTSLDERFLIEAAQ